MIYVALVLTHIWVSSQEPVRVTVSQVNFTLFSFSSPGFHISIRAASSTRTHPENTHRLATMSGMKSLKIYNPSPLLHFIPNALDWAIHLLGLFQ